MATLGSAGANKNFSSALTIPASMTLVGYACGGPNGAVRWYRSVEVKVTVPASKVAAVKTAIAGQGVTRYTPRRGGSGTVPGGWTFISFMLASPDRGTQALAATVDALLAAVHTAVTT